MYVCKVEFVLLESEEFQFNFSQIKHMEGGTFGVSSEQTALSVDFEKNAGNLPGGYTNAESLPQFPWIDSSEHIISCVARRWLQEEVQFLVKMT